MRRSYRMLIRGGLVVFGLWVLVVVWGFVFAWRPLPYYAPDAAVQVRGAILSPSEYGEVIATHERPYVVEIDCKDAGAVLLYGAEHTKNPHDPMIDDIRKRWRSFDPTVALCESTLGIMFPGFMNPVATFGEPGSVHHLARDKGIPTYTWEPPRDVLVSHLLERHPAKEVAVRMILGSYFSNLRHGKPLDPEEFVEEYRRKRTQWAGLEETFSSIADIDAYWTERFPDGPDWRDVSDQYGLPGFLSDIDANAPRDVHFARVVVDLVAKGERVFAIAGSSHAVKLEPALRASLCPD